MTGLPIDAILPALKGALSQHGRAVLQAPPGAGKTTRVPLALMEAAGLSGKILMLEPRRLAARAAAERLAEALGERPGGQVGYRMRGDSAPGAKIEVVTEGILTRMLQNDPALPGVGAVIFDEFHERSLNADLGLALCWEARQALRPDLWLLVMSATLDAAPVSALLDDAPVITSEGRAYPVTTHYLDRALPPASRMPQAVADRVVTAVTETQGGVLVFLPGEGEIRQTAAALAGRLPKACDVLPLYAGLPFAAQRRAIAPAKKGRKVVLATAIAETSLTISDVRVVVDAGLARRARFDPGSGMSRLVTEPASKAELRQRAGRAGREGPGDVYCLWTSGAEGARPEFAPPEMATADLTPLALDLALWGSAELRFLTPPPEGALAAARGALMELGALDKSQRITTHGRALAQIPVHPRLAHMLQIAGAPAAALAALLAARDPLRGAPVDLGLRLAALKGRYHGPGQSLPQVLGQIRDEIPRLAKGRKSGGDLSPGQMAALAYPDRIGQRRKGGEARYLLSGGKGARMDNADPLASAPMIVVTDLDGDRREARIRQAAALSLAELRALYGARITRQKTCQWSRRDGGVQAREEERFGALILSDAPWQDAPAEDIARAMLDGVRQIGLHFSPAAARFRARVAMLADLPAMDDATLMASLKDWLLPYLDGVRSAAAWKAFDLLPALEGMLDWSQKQRLEAEAPAHFITPLGRRIAIDYSDAVPQITLRLQEMFGVTRHPMIGKVPLRITLLSPGQKPVQVTQDIVGFWDSSYADVRRDMRGRYPKHPWPEDPRAADPTLRVKPRR